MISVTVSLITWNDREELLRCLRSLSAQTFRSMRIIVVDNGSTDGSAEAVREAFPEVSIMSPGRNLGFAGGHNLSFEGTDEPYFLVLNPDLTLAPDFLALLVSAMEADPSLAALSGKLLRTDEKGRVCIASSIESVEPGSPLLDSAGICPDGRGRFRDRGAGLPDDGRISFGEVWGVCGAAALYRRRAIVDAVPDVQGAGRPFDEHLFLYYEDADLAWALRRRGWRARILPEAVGYHVRGGSGTGARRTEHFLHRNSFWVLIKQGRTRDFLRIAPGWLGYECVKIFQSITYRPGLWRAQWERLLGIPTMWRRRRAIKRNDKRLLVAPLPDYQRVERELRDLQAPVYDAFTDGPYRDVAESAACLERLAPAPGERIVDLGCGTGKLLPRILGHGARAVGVDFSHASLKIAQAKAPDALLVQADVTRLPFRTGVFDRAVSNQVLHHLPDVRGRRDLLAEAARTLGKEGELVLTSYNDALLRRMLSPREGRHPGGIFFHRFHPEELCALLADHFDITASVGSRHIPARTIGERLFTRSLFRWLPRFDRTLGRTRVSRLMAHLWLVSGRKRDISSGAGGMGETS